MSHSLRFSAATGSAGFDPASGQNPLLWVATGHFSGMPQLLVFGSSATRKRNWTRTLLPVA